MSKYTFIYEHNNIFNDSNVCKLTMESNVDSLDDVLEQFEMFLKGAGFVIDGKLDIVKEDDDYSYDDEEVEINEDFDEIYQETKLNEIRAWPFETEVSEK